MSKTMLSGLRDVRDKQLKEKAALLHQRKQIDAQLRHLDHALIHLDDAIKQAANGAEGPVPTLGVTDGAEKILAARNGEAMSIRDLAREMIELGVQSDSKRFDATVYATIRRSPRFVRRKDGLWLRTEDADPKDVKAWQALQDKFEAQVQTAKAKAKRKGARKKK
jgi:hypothetical protein